MYSHTIHLGRIIHNSLTLLLEINKRVNGKYKIEIKEETIEERIIMEERKEN